MQIELECVFNTINLIESEYNNPISVKELENVSHYSYRNIQRIFKYTCGETIGAYQKRLRIENAYKLLLYTKDSFTKIALEVGFENSASFSKAFSQYYGVSPKEARKTKANLFTKNNITPFVSTTEITPEIIYLSSINVFYQSVYTDYNTPTIETLWEKLTALHFSDAKTQYYGLIADEPLITDKIKCRYDACASQQPKEKELPEKKIFGGRYAKFIHNGSYDMIEDTYAAIYANWILTTNLEFGTSAIIEHYIKHASNTENETDFQTAILIPLKK